MGRTKEVKDLSYNNPIKMVLMDTLPVVETGENVHYLSEINSAWIAISVCFHLY